MEEEAEQMAEYEEHMAMQEQESGDNEAQVA
jgi:hypothetical protein